jgi:GntR family transcriptional repressor for pyruvate dehydrogenase complex
LDNHIQLSRVKRVRVSDTVVDQIVTLIKNGTLNIGDQLPGERELVEQLQVARASLREALRILEFQGVIEVQPGKGAFIVGSIDNLYSGEEGVRQWFREHATEYKDIFEVREALEICAARLVTLNISEEEISELQQILDQSKSLLPSENFERIISLDRKFHHLIGEFSRNKLLSELVDITYEVSKSKPSLLRIPGRAKVSLGQHQSILDAIVSRDPDAAAKAVVSHISNIRESIETL